MVELPYYPRGNYLCTISSHGFATRVHRFATKTKALARKIPQATQATGVGEERKTKERNRNGIFPARNWGESQNKKEGVGEEKEGNPCGQTPGF